MPRTAPQGHALADHTLPGLDVERLRRLHESGIGSLEDLVEAGPERLSDLTGFDAKTAAALLRVAIAALRRADPSVIEFAPRQDAPNARLARGLEGARLLESALGFVRRLRSHLGQTPADDLAERPHRRARKQLKKLAKIVEAVQREVLAEGLSQRGLAQLQHDLEPLEASLRSILDAPIRTSTLRRARRVAKDARKQLEQRRRSLPR